MTYEVYAVYGSCIIIGTGSYIVQATFHDFGLCNINATMCSNVIKKKKNRKEKENNSKHTAYVLFYSNYCLLNKTWTSERNWERQRLHIIHNTKNRKREA